MRRLRLLFAVVFGLGITTVTSPVADAVSPPPPPPASSVTVTLATVASGFSSPTSVTSARDGSNRLFVVEKGGLVKLVVGNAVQRTPYLNLSSKVTTGGEEQGLLSIVFHQAFASRPYVYAAYTRSSDGALVVARFTASSSRALVVSAATQHILLVAPHPNQTNHNGGQLLFGADHYLYIGTGDGGGGGDPYRNAESRQSLLGKILRINVDRTCGRLPYCIPSTNPYASSTSPTVRKEIFDIGLRNPWRFTMDRADGTLWIGDVGQDRYEEVDHSTEVGGRDFGWSCREAYAIYDSSRCTINGHARTSVAPNFAYAHGTNDSVGCAIIGGFVYRGPSYAFARGLYLYSDFCSGTIWAFGRNTNGTYASAVVDSGPGGPSGFGESDSGELYLVNLNSGVLSHLVFASH